MKVAFTALLLLVVWSAAQSNSVKVAPKFQWGQGQPEDIDKALADYNSISADDRAALLHALALEYTDDPSPMQRAEQTRVKFIDLNGDGVPEVIAQPTGNICGAANCPLYVFKHTGTKYRVILATATAQTVTVQRTRANAYLDMVVGMHGSATETSLFVYQFHGRQYRRTHCYNETFSDLGKDGVVHEFETPRITTCK